MATSVHNQKFYAYHFSITSKPSPYDHHPTKANTPYATTSYAHNKRNLFALQHGIQPYYSYTNLDNIEVSFQPTLFLFQTHDS